MKLVIITIFSIYLVFVSWEWLGDGYIVNDYKVEYVIVEFGTIYVMDLGSQKYVMKYLAEEDE